MEQKMEEIVAAAKANGGNLYIYSMDDEMTFGVMNYIETASDALKADLKELNVYISAIGGMQELYDVMADTTEGTIANTYFGSNADVDTYYCTGRIVKNRKYFRFFD